MALFERQPTRLYAPQVNGEGRIGNRVDSSLLDSRERTLGFLREIVADHAQDEDDVLGHIQSQPRKLSVATTPQFREIYAFLANRVDRYETAQLRGKIRGHLFAHLAHFEISELTPPGVIVAMEDETFEFLIKTQGLKTIKDEMGKEFAEHKYAPDGMIIDQSVDGPVILALLEYSSHPDFDKFQSQVHGFRQIRRELGLGKSTDFIIVIPGISEEERAKFRRDLALESGLEEYERQHIKVLMTSFTVEEFNRYSNYVLYNYKDNLTGNTLNDLHNERRFPDIAVSKRERNQELRKRVVAMFDEGKIDDIEYVVNHGLKRERPLPGIAGVLDVRTQYTKTSRRLAKIA